MNDHYYTREPQSESRPVNCTFEYRGISLRFETDAGVFSRGEVDKGTRLLLEALPEMVRVYSKDNIVFTLTSGMEIKA